MTSSSPSLHIVAAVAVAVVAAVVVAAVVLVMPSIVDDFLQTNAVHLPASVRVDCQQVSRLPQRV